MNALVTTLCRNWWLHLMQGVFSIVIGVLVLVWPGRRLFMLILFFGLLMMLNGVIAMGAAIGAAGVHEPWAWQVAKGIIGIATGVAILRWPGVTTLVILLLVGAWAIVTGIMDIVEGIADYEEIPYAGLIALVGVISLLFGVAMLAWPAPVSLLVITYLVGLYAIVYGLVTCLIAFRVRTINVQLAEMSTPRRARHAA